MPTSDPFAAARHAMVVSQLKGRGIRDPAVLAAMEQTPRHCFVDPVLADRAYEDSALPSQEGQTISQPYMVALMTEALALTPEHRVLEIGTGTGYQTMILALLAKEIYTIERMPALSTTARERLNEMGIRNVRFAIGDGSRGWEAAEESMADGRAVVIAASLEEREKEGARGGLRFDRILVTAGAPADPQPLLEQLAPEGILVIPEGSAESQILLAVARQPDGRLERRKLVECRFVPLIGQYAWQTAPERRKEEGEP